MPDEPTFGYWIRSLRKARGKTQGQVAEATGIDFTYLSKLENDRDQPPSDEVISRLAKVLQIPEEDLMAAAGKLSPELRGKASGDARFALLLRKLAQLPEDRLNAVYKVAGVTKLEPPSP